MVYRADDTVLQRQVAVKILNETGLDTVGQTKLLHEARAAAQLDYPNFVIVHKLGQSDERNPFLDVLLLSSLKITHYSK